MNRKTPDIVKANLNIKERLIKRFDELKLYNKEICEDAKKRGMKIDAASLSRYLNSAKQITGGLTQDQIIWLTLRYCVPVSLLVGGYKKLENPEDYDLPYGTLIPQKVEYSIERAEKGIIKYFGLKSDGEKGI